MSKVICKLMLAAQDLEAGARITELLVVTEAKGVDGLSEQWPEGRAAVLHVYISRMYVAEWRLKRGINVWMVMLVFPTTLNKLV